MSVRRFLINNYPTWYFSNKFFNFTIDDIFFTEDPYVYEKLKREGFSVIIPSDYMQERKIIDEDMSYKAAHFIKDGLNKQGVQSSNGIAWGNVLNISMAYFVNTVIARARELEYVLDGGNVVIPYLSKDTENNLDSCVGRLNYIKRNYYGLLAQHICNVNSKYKSHINLCKLNYSYKDYDLSKKVTIGIKKISLYRTLSLISGDFNFFERLLFRHIRSGRNNILKNFFKKKIYITGDNRMISSLIVPFILTRNYPEYINIGGLKKETESSITPYLLPIYFSSWMEGNSISELQGVATELILLLIESYINSLLELNNSIRMLIKEIENKEVIFLTNTANNPDISLLYENTKNNNKIKVVAFTDGNSGVNGGDILIEKLAVRSLCDGYVAHNEYEEKSFKKITKNHKQKFYAYNFTYYQRPYFPLLSKVLSRQAVFSGAGNKKYIIYAPTRFKEDSRFIKGDFIDIEYWKFIKKVVAVIGACSEVNAFVKTYGKEAFPGQMKSYVGSPKHPLHLVEFPDNIVIQSYPRLNYMIQAADIVMIDRATSTLQTALISNKIIIFIHNNSHPVSEEILPLLEKSIFIINAFNNYWESELQQLISLPIDNLQKKWKSKAESRENLKRNYVLGIEPSKRKLIAWIKCL